MNLGSHLQELRRKHKALSDEVERAQQTAAIDTLQVVVLKKQKLKLKEQIERLSQA